MKKTLLLLLLAYIASPLIAQDKIDNKDFMQGKFRYCDPTVKSIITIKGKKSTEEFIGTSGQAVIITSKVKWLTEDTYRMRVVKVQGTTLLSKKDTVDTKIIKIDGNRVNIHFTFTSGYESDDCLIRL